MGPITSAELSLVIKSLQGILAGSRVEKIVEPSHESILLVTRGENLHICLSPQFCHLGSMGRISRGESTAFTMLLRKHIGNAIIMRIDLLREGDRIFFIEFSTGHRLLGELSGRHGNIFLLDDRGIILGLHHTSHSTTRLCRSGAEYTAPPPTPGTHDQVPRFVDSHGASSFFAPHMEALEKSLLFSVASEAIARDQKKVTRALLALEKDGARCEDLMKNQRLGELLLIVQYQWPRGETALFLDPAPDGGDPLTVTLPVGISSPVAASQHFFQRAKKGKRGMVHIANRKIELLKKQAELQIAMEDLKTLSLTELKQLVTAQSQKRTYQVPTVKNSAAPQKKANYYRQFSSEDNTPILVGRGAKENHLLTFRTARGNDHWFHARDLPGAHVIIPGVKQLTEALLLDGATLAFHFSDGRTQDRGDVIYTLRKYLRPVKGAPGKVTVSQSKTICINIEPDRLRRLLDSKIL
ncbi:DUF814 domain-containing protein [Myxococcota bacterium]|nr:DUF814 domain-containing protein [Myxococcota bacterium]MBU1534115.1 DUF814 domain-containing protein [Myxococcota bacterium]